MRGVEYRGLSRIEGPVVVTERNVNVGFGETVAVYGRDGSRRMGHVVDLAEDWAAIQIYGSSSGLSADDSRVEFLGSPMQLRVGPGLLGRVFDGLGRPADGYSEIFSSDRRDVNGLPINPYARTYPRDFIQTGVSAIDGMNTLIRGQKLPIFSGNGLAHNRLAAQIVRQAKIRTADDPFVVVFCAMGVKYDVARFFLDGFERSGVLSNVVVFLSLADAPSIERLVAPRCALTAAEYLAYDQGMHVLVVMTDMTNYCEALREVSSIRVKSQPQRGLSWISVFGSGFPI
ncbi:hypothetical protein MASR2M78_05190 [Treponema sp.]